jgi:uncharacterized protein YjiS (DUF1127 family)
MSHSLLSTELKDKNQPNVEICPPQRDALSQSVPQLPWWKKAYRFYKKWLQYNKDWRALQLMSDHELNDIGLSRSDLMSKVDFSRRLR